MDSNKNILVFKTVAIQILKFIGVGALNTLIDFAVFNALIFFTGIKSGVWVILFNSIAFAAAVTNSYFLNKYWTFASKEEAKPKEAGQFIAVSVGGWLLNTGTVYLFTLIAHSTSISPQLWLNIGKIAATGITFVWNFLGYKIFVFKK